MIDTSARWNELDESSRDLINKAINTVASGGTITQEGYGFTIHPYQVERYWHDTPVVQRGCINPLYSYLHINPSHLGKSPLEFPDGAVMPAATLRKFITTWKKAERRGLVDGLGGAQCGAVLWAIAHDRLTIEEVATWT
jgi:hypothetical protein